jgi:undecaprenyl-diphosphatase
VNPFDVSIISFLNGFAHRSWTFDTIIDLISINYLFKGAVVACLIWWAWFRKGEDTSKNRELLLCGLIAGFFAFVFSRGLADTLPFRERPLHNPALHFQLPYGASEASLIGWSSFPSDHAAVFFALATTIFFVSRAAGILALCHAFFIVCLPRIYLGYHYPTDILGGAFIGIGAASFSQITALRTAAASPAMRWMEKYPGISHAFLFLVTFQIAINFDSVRQIGHFLSSLLKAGAVTPH